MQRYLERIEALLRDSTLTNKERGAWNIEHARVWDMIIAESEGIWGLSGAKFSNLSGEEGNGKCNENSI